MHVRITRTYLRSCNHSNSACERKSHTVVVVVVKIWTNAHAAPFGLMWCRTISNRHRSIKRLSYKTLPVVAQNIIANILTLPLWLGYFECIKMRCAKVGHFLTMFLKATDLCRPRRPSTTRRGLFANVWKNLAESFVSIDRCSAKSP